MHKRIFSYLSSLWTDTERSPPKRAGASSSSSADESASVAAQLCYSDFLRLERDTTLFFSVLARDAFLMIAQLLHPVHRRGRVPHPEAMQFERGLSFGCDSVIYMMRFDPNDCVVLVRQLENWICFYNQSGYLVRTVVGLDHPYSCVADSRGRLFVAEQGTTPRIRRFGATGRAECIMGAGATRDAYGMALSPDESVLYVALNSEHLVRAHCAATGAVVREIGKGHVWFPHGVATLSNGDVVVSECADPGSLHVFAAADGAPLRQFGARQLRLPRQIAVDADDNVYVTSMGVHNVVVYRAADMHFIGSTNSGGPDVGRVGQPWCVAVDSAGTVAVTESGGTRVHMWKSG